MIPGVPVALLAVLAVAARGVEMLAPDVAFLPGTFVPGTQPDGNTVVLRGRAGLIVVDTGRHAEHTRAILDLSTRWKEPVAVVVNTHWHLDHVSGNPAIRAAHPGVEVVGSDAIVGARQGFLASYRKQLEAMRAEEKDPSARQRWTDEIARIDAGRALEPGRIVRETAAITLAGRSVLVGLAPGAVTAGDVWLFDPESGILVAGDLLTLPIPLADTACPAGWKAALSRLSEVPFRVVVPGHGRPMSRTEFDRWRTGFDHLVACAATDAKVDACIAGWLADLGSLVPDPERAFARELLRYYLPEHLRAPPGKVAERCGARTPAETVR